MNRGKNEKKVVIHVHKGISNRYFLCIGSAILLIYLRIRWRKQNKASGVFKVNFCTRFSPFTSFKYYEFFPRSSGFVAAGYERIIRQNTTTLFPYKVSRSSIRIVWAERNKKGYPPREALLFRNKTNTF